MRENPPNSNVHLFEFENINFKFKQTDLINPLSFLKRTITMRISTSVDREGSWMRTAWLSTVSLTVVLGGAYYYLLWWKATGLHEEEDDTVSGNEDDGSSDGEEACTEHSPQKKHSPFLKLPSHYERELRKEKRRQAMIPLFIMKKPMYDNIFMHDPQGSLLCTISKKKASWYVKKNLAHWTKEDAIQLTFQPKNKGLSKDERQLEYNRTKKQNLCVVCGAEKDYMRHYVVPYAYRCLFPERFKTHMPHDVVLVCPTHHVEAERHAHTHMRQLEKSLRTDPTTESPHVIDGRLKKIVTSAQALMKYKHKLPPERIEEYVGLLKQYWQVSELTNGILQKSTLVEFQHPNPYYISGPQLVIDSLLKSDGDSDHEKLQEFIRSWRRSFQQRMHPQFLPAGWSVESPVQSDHGV